MFPIFIRLVDELLWTMHTMWPRGFPQTWKLLRKIWKQASIKATQCGKTNMENGIHNELWTCSSQPNIIFALWKVLFSLKFWRKIDSKIKASFDIWIRYDPWCRIPTAKKGLLTITIMIFFRNTHTEKQKIHQSVTGSFCILASQVGNSQLCATPLPPQPVTTLTTGSSNNANTRTITINIVLWCYLGYYL